MLTGSMSHRAGGVFNSVRQLSRAAQGLPGVRVSVFGLRDEHTGRDMASWSDLDEAEALPVVGPASFGYAPGLAKVLRAAKPDVLHAHGLWMYPSVASLAWSGETRRPVLISPHGMLDPWAVRNARWKKRLAGLLYEWPHLRRAACLHALSAAEARAIRAYGLDNPVCVVPNGVELPPPGFSAPPPWQGEIPAGAKVLLFLGRLHPKKNLPALLEAWRQVATEPVVRDWWLVIVGWDERGHGRLLRAFAAERAVPRVHFAGPRHGVDKDACLGNADAFVLPALSEGLPMAVLEAWAHGLPVLMTEECNLPEGFAARAALRIESDPGGIAEGVRQLVSLSEAGRKLMGERGRELVARRFAWPRIAGEMTAVYRWVLGLGPRPACVIGAGEEAASTPNAGAWMPAAAEAGPAGDGRGLPG